MQNDITFFAKTNFRDQQRVFGIKTDDRRRHMYVIGKTGMGKTNLLENLVIQDIQHGHGVAFIDPHGDTAEKIIRAIPADRINDVIYFNPSDQDFPIAFNIMENVSLDQRHLVSSGLIGVFKKLWADSWGPRLEYVLRNAILALLETPGSTLLGVMRILIDKEYRKKIVENVTDPQVKTFWVDEFTKWNDRVLQEVISPIQNKVGQFLSSSLIRNIVGQTKSSFDIREAMDSQKIIILNLSKGRIGEDNSALLGAMMITKIQLAAMGRVDIEEDDRKDFYLYVDEFQNFATESFANILSEARKYRLNLILANQYVSQVDEKVRDAIFGNAGTMISFRIGAADAEFLEKEFEPIFLVNDLVNLPKFNVYLKLMVDGVAGDAFSATVLPPIELKETIENAEKVVRISREHYASSKADVEDKIRRWTGMLSEEERSILVAQATQARANTVNKVAPTSTAPYATPSSIASSSIPRPVQTTVVSTNGGVQTSVTDSMAAPIEKEMFIAHCVVCDTEINVPFKPDGKRPTFCRDHLKEYQRTAARIKEEVMSTPQTPAASTIKTMLPTSSVASVRVTPPAMPQTEVFLKKTQDTSVVSATRNETTELPARNNPQEKYQAPIAHRQAPLAIPSHKPEIEHAGVRISTAKPLSLSQMEQPTQSFKKSASADENSVEG